MTYDISQNFPIKESLHMNTLKSLKNVGSIVVKGGRRQMPKVKKKMCEKKCVYALNEVHESPRDQSPH